MLAVLQLVHHDGDQEELRDSITRKAHSSSSNPHNQPDAHHSDNSSRGEERAPENRATNSASAHSTSRASHSGGVTASDSTEPSSPSPAVAAAAAVTVEDVTQEADNSNIDEDISTAPVLQSHTEDGQEGKLPREKKKSDADGGVSRE